VSNADPTDQRGAREHALEIVRAARFCMVTVAGRHGLLTSSPMTPMEVSDDGEILFLVDTTGELAARVAARRSVNLAFMPESSWLSISGRGKVLHDPTKVADLWTAAAEAWFPDGPSEPRLGVLRVRSRSAQYWETPGERSPTMLSFVKPKATSRRLTLQQAVVSVR